LFEGEQATLLSGAVEIPPDHQLEALVRQVEAGRRVRVAFIRNTTVPIPDIEPVIHALFDSVSAASGTGKVLSVAEVAALARSYSDPSKGN
jgi:hypothetical protein